MTEFCEPYRLLAYNSARQSENKMHDDTVARQLGFAGGLVPGVDVMAYMTHPATARWRRDFLEHGLIEARLHKPVYDGEETTVTARQVNGGLEIEVRSRDERCASGHAAVRTASPPPIAAFTAVAAVEQRPPANEETLKPGRWLGIRPLLVTPAFASQYAADVRDNDPIYADQRLCHPGLLPRLLNWALVHNVVLGPWIHVGSKVAHFAAVKIGDELTVRAKVLANYQRKGHHFVDLDGLIVANGQTPVAQVAHTAIWRPRASPG